MPNKTRPLTDGYLMYSYPKNPTYLLCPTPDNVDMFGIPKNLYFDHWHTTVASEMKIVLSFGYLKMKKNKEPKTYIKLKKSKSEAGG